MFKLKSRVIAPVLICICLFGRHAAAQDIPTVAETTSTATPTTAEPTPTDSGAPSLSADASQPTSADAESTDDNSAPKTVPAVPEETSEESAHVARSEAPTNQQMTIEFSGPQTQAAAPPSKGNQSTSTADEPTPTSQNPFIAVGDEMFLGMAFITAWGIHFWDWFEEGFHFEKEHGFKQESSTGGADKTGHFYTSYIIADFLNWRLRKQGWTPLRSSIVSASVAMGLMTWIEIGDATSAYGFSWEDMLADFIGVAISAGLGLSPTADELFDFRLEYWPTKSYLDGGVMAADYSGMKYLMALRMTGIKPLKQTPLRFVEFHLGYYTRGFRTFDNTKDTNRVLYFGMGVDLKEIFDKFIPKKYKRPFDVAFTYYQPPYTSWPIHKWEHPWSAPTTETAAPAPVPQQ